MLPLALFVVAAVPRLWAPDLVPYGSRQAAHLVDAGRYGRDAWASAYAELAMPPLALVETWLRELPASVAIWGILRGVLDGLGVALLWLAARQVIGVFGATLAALLLALMPAAWAAARDPAGPFGPLLMAAALLAAVRLVRRPTLVGGALFGVTLGLLARSAPPGWGLVLAGAATLALARASWQVGGLTALALVGTAGPALWHRAAEVDPARGVGTLALQAPGLLLLGPAYDAPEGLPASAVVLADRVPASVAIVLLLGLAVAGTIIAVDRSRRRGPVALLAPIWAVVAVCWSLAATAAACVAAVPALALLLAMPAVARQRVVRWAGRALVILVLAFGTVTIGWSIIRAEEMARQAPSLVRPDRGRLLLNEPGVTWIGPTWAQTTLREWEAAAEAARAAAGRAGTGEIVVAAGGPDEPLPLALGSLLRGEPGLRLLPASVDVLPLARETLFLLAPSRPASRLLERPSSAAAVVTLGGVDTGARLLTLRPRPARDWLAHAQPVTHGRFADGSALVGVAGEPAADGGLVLRLYWDLPMAGDPLVVGSRVRAMLGGADAAVGPEVPLPDVSARRPDELIGQGFASALPLETSAEPPVLTVTLVDAHGRAIPTADGQDALTVPLGPGPGQ